MFGRDGKKQDARRWAAEIDAAADAAVANRVATNDLGGEAKANGNLAGNGAGLGREAISTMGARVLENDRNGTNVPNEMASANASANGAPDARMAGNGAAILGVAGERMGTGNAQAETENAQSWMNSEAGDGRRAIYSPELNETNAEAARRAEQAEIVTGMAEVDNGYGKEYIPGVMTAENESPYEIEQRKKLEAENRWNEDHPNGSRDAKIVAHDQEGHGKVARSVVDGEYLNRDFEVRSLLSWFGIEQNATLNDLENPHPIGKGNG